MSYALLRRLLVRHEGVKLFVYDDATGLPIVPGSVLLGHPTIGVGRALDTHGITEMEAMAMLAGDIEAIMQECLRFIWFNKLEPARQDVVASMIFQLGPTGFRTFTKMIEAVSSGDYARAADEMLNSAWATNIPQRALELSQMMRLGRDGPL